MIEIEHKYETGADVVLPDFSGLPGGADVTGPESQELVASYFDTADLRLAASGITLRRRVGGHDAGWHLKLPVAEGVRRELHAPLGKSERTVPARLATLVAGYTRGRVLRPVATLETRRTVIRLIGGDDAFPGARKVLAEVADDEVTGRVAGEEALSRWREIEVELVAGSPKLLDAAGRRLREAGARPAANGSKLIRLLDGRVPQRPPAKYRTGGQTVVSYVAAQVETILGYDPLVRLGEPDSVHQMRVAVRRIRSILRSCGSLLEASGVEPLKAELKWLANELGEVRDSEVLVERFAGRLDEAGERSASWLTGLGDQHRAAAARLNKTLRAQRYFAVLDALESFVADPPLVRTAARKARKTMPGIVAKAWRRVGKRFAEIKTADEPTEARHDARKAAKRARYTADAAVPVLGRPAKDLAQQAKRLQQSLGEYQDSVVAQEHLAWIDRTGDEAFTLGVISGLERCAAERALQDIDTVWKEVSKPKYLKALSK